MKRGIAALTFFFMLSAQTLAAKVKTDIEYGKAGGELQLLDVYEPVADGVFPAVIVVHGGGWSGGDKQKDMPSLMEPITDANIVCYSINYRLAPKNKWPACYDDVKAAIRWVKANAATYKTDPNRIAIMGYSAGGQLACLAAVTADKDTAVAAVVGLAAPTDLIYDSLRRGNVTSYLLNLFGNGAIDANTVQKLWEISPINNVKPGLVPFLLVHGTADQTVPYQLSVNFKKRLETMNVPCDMITIKGAPHNLMEWPQSDPSCVMKIVEWLVKTLNKK